MNERIFRNAESRLRFAGWYDKFLKRINAATETRFVETSRGESLVLLAGNATRRRRPTDFVIGWQTALRNF